MEYLNGARVSPIVQAFYEFNQLKSLYRQGWLNAGISREQCETVAEHSLGVALLGLWVVEEYGLALDLRKVLLMGLLHDFGEIYAGDIVPGKMGLEEKSALEEAAVERIFGRLVNGAEYVAVWKEFEAGESAEARLMKQLDKLEMALQASVYEKAGMGELGQFFESASSVMERPELQDLMREIEQLRR